MKEIVEYVHFNGGSTFRMLRDGVDEWVSIADEIMENERCVLRQPLASTSL